MQLLSPETATVWLKQFKPFGNFLKPDLLNQCSCCCQCIVHGMLPQRPQTDGNRPPRRYQVQRLPVNPPASDRLCSDLTPLDTKTYPAG